MSTHTTQTSLEGKGMQKKTVAGVLSLICDDNVGLADSETFVDCTSSMSMSKQHQAICLA